MDKIEATDFVYNISSTLQRIYLLFKYAPSEALYSNKINEKINKAISKLNNVISAYHKGIAFIKDKNIYFTNNVFKESDHIEELYSNAIDKRYSLIDEYEELDIEFTNLFTNITIAENEQIDNYYSKFINNLNRYCNSLNINITQSSFDAFNTYLRSLSNTEFLSKNDKLVLRYEFNTNHILNKLLNFTNKHNFSSSLNRKILYSTFNASNLNFSYKKMCSEYAYAVSKIQELTENELSKLKQDIKEIVTIFIDNMLSFGYANYSVTTKLSENFKYLRWIHSQRPIFPSLVRPRYLSELELDFDIEFEDNPYENTSRKRSSNVVHKRYNIPYEENIGQLLQNKLDNIVRKIMTIKTGYYDRSYKLFADNFYHCFRKIDDGIVKYEYSLNLNFQASELTLATIDYEDYKKIQEDLRKYKDDREMYDKIYNSMYRYCEFYTFGAQLPFSYINNTFYGDDGYDVDKLKELNDETSDSHSDCYISDGHWDKLIDKIIISSGDRGYFKFGDSINDINVYNRRDKTIYDKNPNPPVVVLTHKPYYCFELWYGDDMDNIRKTSSITVYPKDIEEQDEKDLSLADYIRYFNSEIKNKVMSLWSKKDSSDIKIFNSLHNSLDPEQDGKYNGTLKDPYHDDLTTPFTLNLQNGSWIDIHKYHYSFYVDETDGVLTNGLMCKYPDRNFVSFAFVNIPTGPSKLFVKITLKGGFDGDDTYNITINHAQQIINDCKLNDGVSQTSLDGIMNEEKYYTNPDI